MIEVICKVSTVRMTMGTPGAPSLPQRTLIPPSYGMPFCCRYTRIIPISSGSVLSNLDTAQTVEFPWLRQPNVHPDIHVGYYTPEAPDTIILGHDGGLTKLYFNGGTFSLLGSINNGYNVTQFYTGTYVPN